MHHIWCRSLPVAQAPALSTVFAVLRKGLPRKETAAAEHAINSRAIYEVRTHYGEEEAARIAWVMGSRRLLRIPLTNIDCFRSP